MKPQPGTYALILRSDSVTDVQIGRWGVLTTESGYYIYVGSAFGPGGVKARVLRHCRKVKSKHWHIDYLREHVNPVGAWYSYGSRQLEHLWARTISGMEGVSMVKGFGCSDCKCGSHLFLTALEPDLKQFIDSAGDNRPAFSRLR